MTARDVSLDVARGLAIVAIVLGHVGRGLVGSSILDSSVGEALDRGLYLTHLIVFVFVSGLLAPASAARRGVRAYTWARVRLFLYLYVVWSIVQGVVRVALSGQTNTAMSWGELLQLWVPRGHLWFLPFMAAATLVLGLARPWASSRRWSVLAAVTVSLATWGLFSPWIFLQGWPLIGALFVGAALGAKRASARHDRASTPALLGACIVAGTVYALLLLSPAGPPTYFLPDRAAVEVLLGAAASATGLVLVLLMSVLLTRTRLAGAFALLGRQSLVIYLAHILAASGMRILLTSFGVQNAVVHLVAGVVAGVLLPLALVWLARHRAFRWLVEDTPLQGVARQNQEGRP
ncbi:acyltransferase family protein [Ornithinimicrobium cerasi]|uniref:Fucose 4-O-acetylase n=1 Tax=Ornithinimicrobium cerasi TaxID=2248773 RepID=A0A285VV16_9MICO|nr:acyltransferase [Ornithinimicrobium cerasi]SOC57803.1 Fucose 4-O-acetylase [Ornithinimicrobium cerasi]